MAPQAPVEQRSCPLTKFYQSTGHGSVQPHNPKTSLELILRMQAQQSQQLTYCKLIVLDGQHHLEDIDLLKQVNKTLQYERQASQAVRTEQLPTYAIFKPATHSIALSYTSASQLRKIQLKFERRQDFDNVISIMRDIRCPMTERAPREGSTLQGPSSPLLNPPNTAMPPPARPSRPPTAEAGGIYAQQARNAQNRQATGGSRASRAETRPATRPHTPPAIQAISTRLASPFEASQTHEVREARQPLAERLHSPSSIPNKRALPFGPESPGTPGRSGFKRPRSSETHVSESQPRPRTQSRYFDSQPSPVNEQSMVPETQSHGQLANQSSSDSIPLPAYKTTPGRIAAVTSQTSVHARLTSRSPLTELPLPFQIHGDRASPSFDDIEQLRDYSVMPQHQRFDLLRRLRAQFLVDPDYQQLVRDIRALHVQSA